MFKSAGALAPVFSGFLPMHVVTHKTHTGDRLRRARRLQYGGLLSLAFSVVLTLGFGSNPAMVLLAYPFLLAGFPLWMIGRSTVVRLTRGPVAANQVAAELKGLSVKYALHNNARVAERVVEHLLITPVGIIVMATSDAVGPVYCDGTKKGDRWRSRSNILDRMTGRTPPIGNPTLELDQSIDAVKRLLKGNGKPDVPVAGLTVFLTNPEIEVNGCTYPAVPMNEVKHAVRDLQAYMEGDRQGDLKLHTMLTSEDRKRLNAALSAHEVVAVRDTAAGRK